MQKFITDEQLAALRKEYPKGTRIELIEMDDPYNTELKPGALGTVYGVDDAGNILVHWDCGSSLSVVWGVDKIKLAQN